MKIVDPDPLASSFLFKSIWNAYRSFIAIIPWVSSKNRILTELFLEKLAFFKLKSPILRIVHLDAVASSLLFRSILNLYKLYNHNTLYEFDCHTSTWIIFGENFTNFENCWYGCSSFFIAFPIHLKFIQELNNHNTLDEFENQISACIILGVNFWEMSMLAL